jgi:polyisoprenoid-binding protein YceI
MKRLLLALTALAAAASLSAETYTIDPVHSSLRFTLRHVVSKFTGSFTKITGTVNYDAAAPEKSTVEATIAIGSVNTADDKRNGHLLSPDFFDAAKFPVATFKSKSFKKTGADTFDVTGDLTIKDVTRPVTLQASLLGTGQGMGGATVIGWDISTKLNKSDYGVNGPAMLGKVLGDEVAINISIEAGHKPAK